jgi:DNA-binding transcriptional regulator/RsmH inhibitor MraZ
MPRHEDEPLVRKHLLLYQKDWELIEQHFLKRNMGASFAIRTIIRAFFKRIESTANDSAKRIGADLPDELIEGD